MTSTSCSAASTRSTSARARGRDRRSGRVDDRADAHGGEPYPYDPVCPAPPADQLARARPTRSSSAARALGSSSGASGSRPRSAPRSATRRTGDARCPASATRRLACSSPASPRPRTGPTAPAGSSPAIARATCLFALVASAPASPTRPTSVSADDGLELRDAVRHRRGAVRAAGQQADARRARPVPAVPPTRAGAARAGARRSWCSAAFAYEALARVLAACGSPLPVPRPKFAHGVEVPTERCAGPRLLPPVQQNTFTGKLTEPMIDEVFRRARELADGIP